MPINYPAVRDWKKARNCPGVFIGIAPRICHCVVQDHPQSISPKNREILIGSAYPS